MKLNRRDMMTAAAAALVVPGMARAEEASTTVWTFDNLSRIGGFPVETIGGPRVIDSPRGPAILFDGVDDAVFIDNHPLAHAEQFTLEAVFRPDGGEFEQRWLHLESFQDPPVEPGRGDVRTLFEIRVVEAGWYLDAFTSGLGYKQPLMTPERLHPIGEWSHVAQTFDGTTYKAFVDGVLQSEASIPFRPHGPGRAAAGARMNRVSFFRGAIREARFTPRALPPQRFAGL